MTRWPRGSDHHIGEGLQHRHRRAIDHAVGNHAGQVLGRVLTTRFHKAAEISHQLGEDGDAIITDIALHVHIAGTKQLLRASQHERGVILGQAEDGHDDRQRHEVGDVSGEVALTTTFPHPVDPGAANVLHPSLETRNASAEKRALRDSAVFAVFAVVRLVHVEDGAHGCSALAQGGNGVVLHLARHDVDARLVNEAFLLPLDLDDMGMLGHLPKQSIGLLGDPGHRRLAAVARIALVQRDGVGVEVGV